MKRDATQHGTWTVDGWTIRIEPGRKGPGDVRIWVSTPGGEPSLMRLSTLGAVASLWFQNEERLYPPPAAGGEYVLRFLRECCESDLRTACWKYQLRAPHVQRIDDEEAEAA